MRDCKSNLSRAIQPTTQQSARRDSNPRPQPWQGCAPPTEPLALISSLQVICYVSLARKSIPYQISFVKLFFTIFISSTIYLNNINYLNIFYNYKTYLLKKNPNGLSSEFPSLPPNGILLSSSETLFSSFL